MYVKHEYNLDDEGTTCLYWTFQWWKKHSPAQYHWSDPSGEFLFHKTTGQAFMRKGIDCDGFGNPVTVIYEPCGFWDDLAVGYDTEGDML
jgi:hypothetical protein